MKEVLKRGMLKFENSFFSHVVRCALGMIIPLVLTGGISCAVRDFPVAPYQMFLTQGGGRWFYDFLTMVYEGTYGIFSVALVITIAYSYAMEKNESLENVVMYVVVALAAFSAQLNLGTEDFDVAGLGTTGCFAAMFIGYLSCMAFSKLRRCHKLMLEQYTAGMGGGCVLAIRTLIPLGIVAAGSGGLNLLIGRITGIYGCYQWFNHIFYAACQNIADYSNFLSGLLYTFAVNLMWFFGLHGSHILEAVAVHNFGVTGNVVFSKAFYDVYVAMGGCGTTVSVLTPVVCYCLAYAATVCGFLPVLTHEVVWSTPVGIGGYLASGSWKGIAVQAVGILAGILFYLPFLKINQRMEVYKAKRHVQVLIHELQEKEEQIDQPVFLTRGDHIGMISRMLLLDLKHAIKNKELYMLYQPQVYSDGICIGAEALLRWNHPVYGMIYPPLIIYLAEAGKVLPELERFIIDEVTDGIVQTRAQYDSDFKISVNITAHSLLWDIEGYIRQTMEQKEIDAHMLWIEITEQDILLQTDVVVRKLEELKKQGHKLLIDDFGMGHTSLLYLQSEYFDVVKLDGSLTRPLLKSHTNQKIVRSIIELGQELGVNVIAEFVENREQRDLLDTLGCHCYQGYLYAKPLELEEFITYMKQMNEK